MGVPVVIGNCVTYDVAMQLMRAGAAGVLVGIGPGAACTSRGVLGVGIPSGHGGGRLCGRPSRLLQETGRHVPIVADGGIVTGGDICKCIACGADAVMIGSPSPALRRHRVGGSTGVWRHRALCSSGNTHQRRQHRKLGTDPAGVQHSSTTEPTICWAP